MNTTFEGFKVENEYLGCENNKFLTSSRSKSHNYLIRITKNDKQISFNYFDDYQGSIKYEYQLLLPLYQFFKNAIMAEDCPIFEELHIGWRYVENAEELHSNRQKCLNNLGYICEYDRKDIEKIIKNLELLISSKNDNAPIIFNPYLHNTCRQNIINFSTV